jgi:hypothetical protein
MKKYIILIFLLAISSSGQASDPCSKYDGFKKDIEIGNPAAAETYAGICNSYGCDDAQVCLYSMYRTLALAPIELPQSSEILESLNFDIGIKGPDNKDAIDDAVAGCNAESLFFLRLYGADKVISDSRRQQIVAKLNALSQQDAHIASIQKNPDKRNNILSKKLECDQSAWIMGQSKKDIQSIASDDKHLEAAHAALIANHFSDVAQDQDHVTKDIIELIIGSTLYRSLSSQETREVVGASSTPSAQANQSQVDRMLVGLLKLNDDQSGIFKSSGPERNTQALNRH